MRHISPVQFRVVGAHLRVDSISEVIFDLTPKNAHMCVSTPIARKALQDNMTASDIKHYMPRVLNPTSVRAVKRPSAAWMP
jgi:hypothetical protein